MGEPTPLVERFKGEWKAGPIAPCDGSTEGFFRSVHIVAVCLCGAAFVSTDGTIAVRMAVEHEQAHAAREE